MSRRRRILFFTVAFEEGGVWGLSVFAGSRF